MRPRELTVRGFRSYADEATFDFTDRSLVGIVGPIGSGKSSILDAVAFALYGKTPRIERDTKSLINQRRDSLHVSLTFDVDGSTWRVVRSLRRNGQSAHVLYREDDAGEHEVADRAREVGEQVLAIIGMDFDAFRRSVLLAQNRFAEFLEATPVQRGRVLKGVFGFERLDEMRDAAKRRLDAVGAGLQVLAERRATADGDRTALPGKREALAGATERASRLRRLRVEVGEIDETIRGLEAGEAAAGAELAGLDALADLIPEREGTEAVLAAAAAAADTVATATAELDVAAATAASAREAHAAEIAAAGGQEAIDEASQLVSRVEAARDLVARERVRLAEENEATQRAEAGAARVDAARDRAVQASVLAAAEAETAEKAAEEARAVLHAAHTADRARSLRAILVAGEACPVCEQLVTTVPDLGEGVALDEMEEAAVAATRAADEAREAEAAARAAAAAAQADARGTSTRGGTGPGRRGGRGRGGGDRGPRRAADEGRGAPRRRRPP
jgi:DNA repair protein SbcC/Rad50